MDELEKEEDDIPLHPYFQKIRVVLESESITPSTPIRMKDCLHNLSVLLLQTLSCSWRSAKSKAIGIPQKGKAITLCLSHGFCSKQKGS